ncbi:hypothetical protein [Halobacillus litoralis]|uniref:hypothetical protein n=1 Tax=Halobacillus litoralis TaxID=45668 RepID=UPI00321F9D0A
MEITMDKLKIDDAQDLFDFESENRAFFEKMVPSRGEDYYNFETFMVRHNVYSMNKFKTRLIFI